MGPPADPVELARHACIIQHGLSGCESWRFTHGQTGAAVAVSAKLSINSAPAALGYVSYPPPLARKRTDGSPPKHAIHMSQNAGLTRRSKLSNLATPGCHRGSGWSAGTQSRTLDEKLNPAESGRSFSGIFSLRLLRAAISGKSNRQVYLNYCFGDQLTERGSGMDILATLPVNKNVVGADSITGACPALFEKTVLRVTTRKPHWLCPAS